MVARGGGTPQRERKMARVTGRMKEDHKLIERAVLG
jgi:hypothetical protein